MAAFKPMQSFQEAKVIIPQQHPAGASSGGLSNNICPLALKMFGAENEEYLKKLYREANEYHNFGGNLKAIQRYLDSRIDATYKIRGWSFEFDDTNNGDELSTSKRIVKTLKDRDSQNRGGYLQRTLPGKFKPNGERFVSVIEGDELGKWDIVLGPILNGTKCKGFKVIEGPPRRRHEDKFMCGYDQFLANGNIGMNSAALNQQEEDPSSCNFFSIGGNDQWSFESAVIADTRCMVHTFDCTIKEPKHKPVSPQITFYSKCIDGKEHMTEGRSFTTYDRLLEISNLTKAPDYFKMDVEGYEYDVLTDMIRRANEMNQVHLLPTQLQIEFHFQTWMFDLNWSLRNRQTGELAIMFSMLFREGGYIPVHVKTYGNGAPGLAELLLVRVYC